MPKLSKISSTLVLFIALIVPAAFCRAQPPLHTATRVIVKEFKAGAGGELSIENEYGDVVIRHTKEKAATVRITLSGQSEQQSRANDLVKLVRITTQTNGGLRSIKTVVDTLSTPLKPTANEQCHIRYEVFIPPGINLKVTNRYGNIDANNFQDSLQVDEKFGDFTADSLTGPLKLDLEQGNISIGWSNNANLTVKGFQTIRIGAVAGVMNANLASGNRAELGLSPGLLRLDLVAENVAPLMLYNLRSVGADLKVHTLLSKFIYNDAIQFRIEKNAQPGKDSLSPTPQSKKLKALPFMKKENDYAFKTGDARTEMTINVSFCVLNVKN